MHFYTIPPPESLKPYVRCYWVLTHDLGAGENYYVYRSVGDGCVEIVFHYQGEFDDITNNTREKCWHSGIQAQTDRFSRFITEENFGIFGAYLYPYAVPQLFGVAAEEMTNQAIDLETFLSAAGRQLEEQVMMAKDNFERANILSNFLEARLLKTREADEPIFTAIRQVIHHHRCYTVTGLAGAFSLSTRQFDRKFKKYAGFSPKLYLRLTRLQAALRQYGSNKRLTQIAYECGYYDQSHFIHDVKAFTGYHPGFYFSGRAEGTEYREI